MNNFTTIIYRQVSPYLKVLRIGLIIIGLILLILEGFEYDLLKTVGVQSLRIFGLKVDFLAEAALMASEIRGRIRF